ncbi:MAG: IS200/IS605 family transposase [Candidatus Micrarchaeota archaeon]
MGSASFVNATHSVGINSFHFEWCPKYRYKCMRKPEIAAEMEQILRCIAAEKGIVVIKIAVDADHIHLLVSIPFSMSVSQALQFLKGGSSFQIFRLHPNFRLRYPRGHFWSPGHFSRSLSNVSSKTVEHYLDCHDSAKLNETISEGKTEARQLSLASFQS